MEHFFDIYLVKKPHTKSKVWQNFRIMATGDISLRHVEVVFKQSEATQPIYFSTCANIILSYTLN